MSYRKNIYFDETTLAHLETKDNFSEYIQDLILKDMNDKTKIFRNKEKLLEEKKDLQIRLAEIDSELLYLNTELERIESLEHDRPEGYEDVVTVLLHLPGGVRKSDLSHQAKRLGVAVGVLKRWLFDDGIYDQLFLR